MTFLAPLWFAAATALSAVVVALHLFARRRPQTHMLPTARFIPPHSAQATTRTVRPTDLLLLLLRVLLLLAVGAALAKPMFTASREPRAGIVLADVSRATQGLDALTRRVAAVRRPGDLVIPFDSAPRAVLQEGVAPAGLSRAQGSLSVGLIAAFEASRALGERADSIELTVVSALREEEIDRATIAIRALWPGRITIERLDGIPSQAAAPRVGIRSDPSDPLAAAVRLLPRGGAREVRVVRGELSSADSAWAADSGRVLVYWPTRPAMSVTRPDTATGLIGGGDAVVVAPFMRSSRPPDGRVVARWSDGAAAATELATGAGCVRHVAVVLPVAGDLTLRADFLRLLHELLAPCGGTVLSSLANDSLVNQLRGAGPLADGRAFPAPLDHGRTIAPWLLAFALLIALGEPFVRRQGARK